VPSRRPRGEPRPGPDFGAGGGDAEHLAQVARALGDPVRLQIVDVLHHHAGAVCVCEIYDLFDLAQSTVPPHLKVLRDAGVADYEKRGVWGYYVKRDVVERLGSWLLETPKQGSS
jgi:ArsR family transcriptional regulator